MPPPITATEPAPEPEPAPETDADDAPTTAATDVPDGTDKATRHPLVRAALETFPGARVESVRRVTEPARNSGSDDSA